MLKSIRIENWKSHLATELYFGAGPNVLVGIMGSGKSSVVEAMSFALFGTFPALQSKKVTMDQLLLSAPQKDSAQIEMEFVSGGKLYKVKREVKRGKGSSAEIRVDGELLEVNPQNVNKVVKNVLGMDYDLFSKAVYSEQNGIDYFLRIPKGQRMEHIDRMLKLDRYERAREGCIFLRNKVKSRASELLSVIADLEAGKPEESLKRSTKEAKAIEDEMQDMSMNARSIHESIDGMEKKLSGAESIKLSYDDARSEARSIDAGLAEMDTVISQKRKKLESGLPDDVKKLASELEAARKALTEARGKERDLREQMASMNTTIRMLREDTIPELNRRNREKVEREGLLQGLEKQFPGIEETMPKLKSQLDKAIQDVSSMEAERKEIKKNLSSLGVGKCPTCEQEVTPIMKKSIEKKRRDALSLIGARLLERRAALETLDKRYKKLDAAYMEISMIRSQLRDYEDIATRLSEIEKTVTDNKRRSSTLVKQITSASSEVANLESKERELATGLERSRSLAEEAILLKELEAKRVLRQERRQELAKDLERLSGLLEGVDITSLREDLTTLKSERASLAARLEATEKLLREKMMMVKELEGKVDVLSRYKNDVSVDEGSMQTLQKLESILGVTQQQLRQEFIKSVNSIMDALWPELYPYGDFTEIRLGVEDDYVLQLRRRDEWLSADGIVSGGERSLACLALRVAFSLAFMPKLRWLMLDEPTHNLDRNAVEKLSEVIRERSHLFAEQVFVITHDERLSEGMPSIRLERDKMSGGHTIARGAGI